MDDRNTTETGKVDERMVKFIKKHHVLTLATSGGGVPYCCNIFYAYDAGRNLFVFTSDLSTKHGADMVKQGFVAASIVLETRNVGIVQGLQIQGEAVAVKGAEDNGGTDKADTAGITASAKSTYLKRFPYAAAADLSLWVLRPTFMKLTDNRLGFGKKLYWGERRD